MYLYINDHKRVSTVGFLKKKKKTVWRRSEDQYPVVIELGWGAWEEAEMGCNRWPSSYSLGRTDYGKPELFSSIV